MPYTDRHFAPRSRRGIYELDDNGRDLRDFIVEDEPTDTPSAPGSCPASPSVSSSSSTPSFAASAAAPVAKTTLEGLGADRTDQVQLVPHTYTWVTYAGRSEPLLCFVDPGAEQLRVYSRSADVPCRGGDLRATFVCSPQSIPSRSRSIQAVSDRVTVT